MSDAPDFLKHLEWDAKRRIPVPYVTTRTPEGVPDFTSINEARVLRCARLRLCGICENEMGYWVAFLGGPKAAENRAYFDPPMHEECARYSVVACPYIARTEMKRRKNPLMPSVAPDGMELRRPEYYALYLTRSWRLEMRRDGLVFRPAPAIRLEVLEETRKPVEKPGPQ